MHSLKNQAYKKHNYKKTPNYKLYAIDHAHVKPDAVIAGAREIAFFPPMTGG